MRINLLIAACAVLLFHAVSVTSGRITVDEGHGWDGRAYARMVTEGIDAGSVNTRTRPLLPLVTRLPNVLGLDPIDSFVALNLVYAFLLYLGIASLLERYGASHGVRAVLVGNLTLCIAISQMFAFYPVQIDLGALAITTWAFYFAASGRILLAGLTCVLATASREFGVAAALFGMHRAIRQGRRWQALAYLPSLVTIVLIRGMVTASPQGDAAALGIGDALQNLTLWASPTFVMFFLYSAATVFGGISALLVLRPAWCARRLWNEPELGTFLGIVTVLTIAGSLDIWRYLVFALPVAAVLIAQYSASWGPTMTPRMLVVMTAVTLLTQRPFERMDEARYFKDWFPLYYVDRLTAPPNLGALWSLRAAAFILLMTAIGMTLRRWQAEQVKR